MSRVAALNEHKHPLAFVDTYGCQQNEADSEKLRGMLSRMGYRFTDDEHSADIIVINTCAVREHAEHRILGNVGALTHTKRAKPGQKIVLCGCMVQQKHMAERIKRSFPIVDLVFGPHEMYRFPELIEQMIQPHKGRIFAVRDTQGEYVEGLPSLRQGRVKAWLTVMYGCNNFCSYCVVPLVRGRERSRSMEAVVAEAKRLAAEGVPVERFDEWTELVRKEWGGAVTVDLWAPSEAGNPEFERWWARLLLLFCRAIPPPVWALVLLFVLFRMLLHADGLQVFPILRMFFLQLFELD